jgi:membrane-bound lytic murein transglycosylase MltF
VKLPAENRGGVPVTAPFAATNNIIETNNILNKQTTPILRVAVYRNPLIYQKISFGNSKVFENGYEYEILKNFAEDNHYQLKIDKIHHYKPNFAN